MEEISQVINRINTQQTNSSLPTRSRLSSALQRNADNVIKMFGSDNEFKMKVTPDKQVAFGKNKEAAVMGNYPTLIDINAAYGNGFAVEWLMQHIANLAMHTGAKNLSVTQEHELAEIICAEYPHLKITEIMLFFYRFKTGRYGRFYGNVDPMIIVCALREFMSDRAEIIDHALQQQRREEQERDRELNPPITRQQWLEMKNT